MFKRYVPPLFLFVCLFCFQNRLPAQQAETPPAQDQTPQEQTQQQQSTDQSQPGSPAKQDEDTTRARAAEVSSSKDTRIDLSPPADDARSHPQSGSAIVDAEESASEVQELHPWDPHKAAKDIEVGDYYFKRKNYRAALDRYKEALVYKPNDAIANFRLAECEEKSGQPADAITHYEAYLKILPHGPDAAEAQKSLDHLKGTPAKETSSK